MLADFDIHRGTILYRISINMAEFNDVIFFFLILTLFPFVNYNLLINQLGSGDFVGSNQLTNRSTTAPISYTRDDFTEDFESRTEKTESEIEDAVFLGRTQFCTTNLRIWYFFGQETYIHCVAQ